MKKIKLTYSESCSIVNCINEYIKDIEINEYISEEFKKKLLIYYTNLLRKYIKLEDEILKIELESEAK